MTKNRILTVGLVLLISSPIIYLIFNFAPGRYPFVEKYELPYKEDIVIEVVTKFKKDTPQFNVPMLKYPAGFFDTPSDGRPKGSNWYHLYFYDKEQKWIFKTWVREDMDIEETTFALVSVSRTGTDVNWETVNNDMPRKENKAAIKRFEELILAPIEAQLKRYEATNK